LASIAAQIIAVTTVVVVAAAVVGVVVTVVLAVAAVVWARLAPLPDAVPVVVAPELEAGPIGLLPAGEPTSVEIVDVVEVER